MKGLLYQQLRLFLRSAGRMYLLITVCYLMFAFVWEPSMYTLMCTVILYCFLSVPYTILSLDEAAGWPNYLASLPVSRRLRVGAVYVMALLCLMAGLLASLLFGVILGVRTGAGIAFLWQPLALGTGISLMSSGLMIALAFRFGTAKSRPISMVVMILLFAAIGVLQELGGRGILPQLTAPALLLGGAALFAATFFISARIYERKEL